MIRALTLLVGVIGLLATGLVHADVPQDNALDEIVQPFLDFKTAHVAGFIDAVRSLFWNLVFIEFVVSGAFMLLNGRGDIGEVFAFITQRVLIIGLFFWFLENGGGFSDLIIRTLAMLGASTSGIQALDPTEIFDQGLGVATAVSQEVSFWSPADSLGILISALIIVVVFALIAGMVLVTMCEMFVLSTAGVILLGLGGSSWTREYAIAYFKTMLSLGFKILAFQVIVGLSMTVMQGWLVDLETDNVSILGVVGTTIVLAIVANSLPASIQAMVSGGVTGSAGIGHAARQIGAAASTLTSASSSMRQGGIAMSNAAGSIINATKNARASGASGVLGTAGGAVGELMSARAETKASNNEAGRRGKLAQLNQRAKDRGGRGQGGSKGGGRNYHNPVTDGPRS